jgi:phage tail-like protein
MDANGQRFWLARGGRPWVPEQPGTLEVHDRFLRLASARPERRLVESLAAAQAWLALVPGARDAFGGRAWYDAAQRAILATSPGFEPTTLLEITGTVTDLALGFDDYLYVARDGEVLVRDQRGRWPQQTVAPAGFEAWRLTPDPAGGAWVLDRTNRQLARLQGQLFPPPPPGDFPPDMFRPQPENLRPLRLELVPAGWLAAGEDPVALAVSPRLGPMALVWQPDGHCQVRRVDPLSGKVLAAATLFEVGRPFSLAWLEDERFAVLAARDAGAAPAVNEALVYQFASGEIHEVGEVFPLRDPADGPFLHGVSLPVEYPVRGGGTRPLVSVSLPAFAPAGAAVLGQRDSDVTGDPGDTAVRTRFDSGADGTAWHRVYVEAVIPPGTGFVLEAAASDVEDEPAKIGRSGWFPHYFGGLFNAEEQRRKPRAAWLRAASEIPGHAGFLDEPARPGEAGLFTVLLQRSGRRVRTLRGRYLHLRVRLFGTGRASPCLHTLRAYAPRFSYQDRYLPELYRESLFGPAADTAAADHESTPADFLGRLLANFEGVLTPLEDKVAASWMVTDPRTAPAQALEWIGSWIGVAFEPWFPPERRREQVRRAAEMFAWRGTRRGLELALDVATGGGVSAGRVIVVEDFWFRRTFATILGVDLDREFDPLFGGPVVTGNSKVGRTLILGEARRREFLALFGAEIQLEEADAAAVERFFETLAHRATVLVHETASAAEFELIRRAAEREAPAHIELRVRAASRDFMVGLASLLGVDTYLRPEPPPEPVEVQRSSVGDGSLLLRLAALDPRMEGRST